MYKFKFIAFPLTAVLLFINCSKGQTNQITTLEYENEINGYNVIVDWKPRNIRFDHIIGPAIIQFKKKDSLIFTITNNNFSVLKKLIPFECSSDSTSIKRIKQNNIKLKYIEPELNIKNGFFTNTVPFFFNDVTFDNKKELLLLEINNGQRGLNTYKVYQFDNEDLELELYNITFKEPFSLFDEYTEIDYVNRRISLYVSGGADNSGNRIFNYK